MAFQSHVVLIGYRGRMASLLREVLKERGVNFRVYSEHAPTDLQVKDFAHSSGVIDFSLPQAMPKILPLIESAKVPYVCGTTGFEDRSSIEKEFKKLARQAPIVWDSNFSLGVEMLCQVCEKLADRLQTPVEITDIHHIHKKDAPSGTALKIQKRIESAAPVKVSIQSIREGEVFGEHRVQFALQDESLEVIHRAHSRRPFALGALRALEWTVNKHSGFFTMKDILQ